MTQPSIPMTAWEQMAAVSLFVVFVLALLGGLLSWMDKQMSKMQTAQAKAQEDWQQFIEGQEEKWRKFISDERAVYAGARKEDRDKIDGFAEGLARLTNLIAEFRQDFNAHVAGEDAKFEMMLDAKARAELATRTRKKVQ